jgi:hypothetical protein
VKSTAEKPAEIRTGYFPHTNLDRHRFTDQLTDTVVQGISIDSVNQIEPAQNFSGVGRSGYGRVQTGCQISLVR